MNRSVIIAGPETDEIKGLIKGFKANGYAVASATDGKKALRLIKNQRMPAGVLLTSSLEGLSALEICKKIKPKKRPLVSPVLILEDTPIANKEEYTNLGVRNILIKPFSSTELHQWFTSLAAAHPKPGLNMHQQLRGVTVVLAVFLAFLMYFIVVPMFMGAKLKKPITIGKKKINIPKIKEGKLIKQY